MLHWNCHTPPAPGNPTVGASYSIAGFEGIFCGLSAIYSAMGQILNAEYGKEVLPLG